MNAIETTKRLIINRVKVINLFIREGEDVERMINELRGMVLVLCNIIEDDAPKYGIYFDEQGWDFGYFAKEDGNWNSLIRK